jgi:hypothetical protein
MDLELTIKSKPIDFELCELLGRGYSDFIVLCFNGVQFEDFGTRYDSPANRADRQRLVDKLNDNSDTSLWPDMFHTWKQNICKQFGLNQNTTAKDFRPVVSLKISRVCYGYSQHLHCAITLFQEVADRIEGWRITAEGERYKVTVRTKTGRNIYRSGLNLPLEIAEAVLRVLKPND